MAYEILTANLPASDAVAIRTTIPLNGLRDFFNNAFLELSECIRAAGASPVGPPFVRYYSVTPESVDVEAVMTCDREVPVTGQVKRLHLNASQAAIVRHVGRYEKMKPAYDAINEWMSNNGKHAIEAPREVYVTTGAEVPDPSEWVTLVEQPIS
ncbi:MAG: GyrI-like domain-containing protein [Archangium sp.]|nr:GyrI-like domain-containing protein [Archangium sp.]MDP3151978.1 GyrI-like domain-containing protein [Archangium sp.]MDP3571391.1 GyrI-like domain-containing protein [Archangium sp.]